MNQKLMVLLCFSMAVYAERAPRTPGVNPVVIVSPSFINQLNECCASSGDAAGSTVRSAGASTPTAAARYADDTGLLLENSLVLIDNTGNVTLNGITKNSNTVSWPTNIGAVGTFLGSDGLGNLVYATPAGAGNVSTVFPFATNNALLTVDLPSGSTNVKQTSVILDGSNNITGINSLTATTLNGTLNGSATSATNFTGPLVGDVTGTQGATVVSFVGGQTAAQVASAVSAANAATNTNTPSTIVKRDASGNFSAGTITANLTGNVTGNLSGNATTATTAVTSTNFTGVLAGDVSGTQGATVVGFVGGQTASSVANATTAANAATSSNTAGTIVKRDGSGNFSAGTITANLTGNVTGNLSGNATTATSATSATTATSFTGPLLGDVTGTQGATVVSLVGGQTAVAVAAATTLANTATSNNTANTIVRRDASGNFITNMVTLSGTVTNPTDAATKAYVDATAASGLVAKTPALVVDTTNLASLSGFPTIDGVITSTNDRVLLVGQSSQVDNGLWLVQSGAWTRPTDFSNTTSAGQAYVLITSGATEAGSSWLCNTPSAIIGTDPITFVQFSLPGTTTGANVGTGAGQIFRDKTGVTLNFKTLAAGTHMVVTNNANDVTLATDATNLNTASTIVSRDGSGNFSAGIITASLTGAASLNVLKAGDTMTGNLTMTAQSAVRFADATSGRFVGLRAPTTVGSSYTVDLPTGAPTVGQVLQASSATATQWATVGGSPTIAKSYYVALNGSDSNDGSFSAPFLTVKHAVAVANGVATLLNPVAINIGAGIFVEDNSGGPITVTADGISIVGSSLASTIIEPNTLATDLFSITTPNVEMTQLSLQGGIGSTANAITQTTTSSGMTFYNNMAVDLFQVGFDISATGTAPFLTFENLQCALDGTCISVSNAEAKILSSVLRGSLTGTSINTGIAATGTLADVEIFGSCLTHFNTAISVTGAADVQALSCHIENTINGLVCSGGSKAQLTGIEFVENTPTSVDVAGSQAGTQVYLTGCLFDCEDATNTPQGTAVQITNAASLIAASCLIEDAVVGIQCGTGGDTSTTSIQANAVGLVDCITDVAQFGTSTLEFFGGSFNANNLSIADGSNVAFSSADRSSAQGTLTLGSDLEEIHTLYQVLTGATNKPNLTYSDDYYGNKGTVYQNPNTEPTFNATQAQSNDATYYVVTGDRTKQASLSMLSDTGAFGVLDNVRGWYVSKQGTGADLAFTYTNNDTSGQAARGLNSVMQLNGFDNQVEFPTAANAPLPTNTVAKLVWAGDTNLYRDSANTLKTDDNLVVGTLTPAGVVHNDVTGLLSTSLIVNADVDPAAGIVDTKLATISTVGKVANSATTATTANTLNTIVLRNGVNGGFSAGDISATNYTDTAFGTAGVVHNAAGGLFSTSFIVNADIAASAAIVDTKLATISTAGKVANSATTATTANTPSTIVLRDGLGNFSAGTITASLTGSASLDVLKSGDTMTGLLTIHPSVSPALTLINNPTAGTSDVYLTLNPTTSVVGQSTASVPGVETSNAIPLPQTPVANASNTKAAAATYVGGVYFLLQDVTFSDITVRTSGGGTGNIELAIYQTANGTYSGSTAIPLKASVNFTGTGASTNITTSIGTPITLKAGLIFVLWGRTSGTAQTLVAYAVGSMSLLNQTVSGYPSVFTTALAVTGTPPATINPSTFTGDNTNDLAILRLS